MAGNGSHIEGVAIGFGLCHERGANITGRTRLVVDDNGLTQNLAQLLA